MKAGVLQRSGRIAGSLALMLFAVGLTGCAGYRVGSMLPGDIRTVHVPIILNHTQEPLLEPEVTRAVLARIQFDGSLRIADAATADSILTIELTAFRTDAIGYNREKDATPNEYRARVDARYTLTNRKTGAVITQSRTLGESAFDAQGDLIRSKSESIPEAADDLARRLVSQLVETW